MMEGQARNFEELSHEFIETLEISWRAVHAVWLTATLLLIAVSLADDFGLFGYLSWLVTHFLPAIIYLISFSLMSWLVVRQAPRQESSWRPLAMRLFANSFFAGLIVGFGVAFFKLFWYHQLWTVFNLITEPLITALIGLIIVGVGGWIYFRFS